jgi:hypothetical protein
MNDNQSQSGTKPETSSASPTPDTTSAPATPETTPGADPKWSDLPEIGEAEKKQQDQREKPQQ